jgi:hypothetical protein
MRSVILQASRCRSLALKFGCVDADGFASVVLALVGQVGIGGHSAGGGNDVRTLALPKWLWVAGLAYALGFTAVMRFVAKM